MYLYIDLFFKYIMNQNCSTNFKRWCFLIEMEKQFLNAKCGFFTLVLLLNRRLRLRTSNEFCFLYLFLKSQNINLNDFIYNKKS